MGEHPSSSPTNDYGVLGADYMKQETEGTIYLAFRDLPIYASLIKDGPVMDFGCGAGRSTRLLKRLCPDVIGVDISEDMLALARDQDPSGTYLKMTPGEVPLERGSIAFSFSSFVFLEMGTQQQMQDAYQAIEQVLQPGGHFLLVTVAEDFYQSDWLTIGVDFPENKAPTSGAPVKVHLQDVDIMLDDYFWSQDDYVQTAQRAGLTFKKAAFPKGLLEDGIVWEREKDEAPFMCLLFEKSAQ